MEDNARSYKVLIAAKYAQVCFDQEKNVAIGTTNKTASFLSKFPFGRFPAADTKDGPLYESSAIAYYLAAHKPKLIGAGDPYASAAIIQYISVADNELNGSIAGWIYPLLGYATYDEASLKKNQESVLKSLDILNEILLPKTYLVGESITLADIVVWSSLLNLYRLVLDESLREKYKNITRWFLTLANQKQFKEVLGDKFKLCVEPLRYTPSALPARSNVPTDEKRSAAVEDGDGDAEISKPAPKNPLDLLPPSTFNLEDWKRFYSNNNTRPDSIKYLWEKYDPQGFSIWRIDYLYNQELTKIFMTCNLVSGLLQRMDRLRKYCFGSILIFGEDNANEISGYLIFRGLEIPPEMKDVADFDSYSFRRVDINDPKERALFEDYLAWDGELGGKKFAEGKTFK